VSLEEARAERRVFLRTLAILLGVDESWVRVAIRRARRAGRRLYTPIYIPTSAPTGKTPAPSLVPTAPGASEPTAADGLSLEPTAADGVSVDYNVSVPSISEAEAVEAVVETTTPADVDDAVETAATEVSAETGTTITLVESIATEEVSAVEIAADPPGPPGDDDDDAPTLDLSEADDGASGNGGDGGSGGGGGGGADAAAAGGAAAGAILLLALGSGLYVYRRRGSKAPAAAEDDVERAISKQLAVPDLLPLHALAPEDVAAWLRRQDLPCGVDGLCAAVIKRKIDGATLRDADDASLRELGVTTLGLRKAVLKLLRAEPPAPRRADEPPPPPPPPPPPLPPPPPALPGHL
jgi:hypothetical protein